MTAIHQPAQAEGRGQSNDHPQFDPIFAQGRSGPGRKRAKLKPAVSKLAVISNQPRTDFPDTRTSEDERALIPSILVWTGARSPEQNRVTAAFELRSAFELREARACARAD